MADPVAGEVAKKELPAEWFEHGHLTLAEHQYDALRDADGLVLVTDWKPFRNPDFHAIKKLMKQHVIFDGRNQYDPSFVMEFGFSYYGIGRGKS